MKTSVVSSLVVRPYRDADEPEVLALLGAALGGGPTGTRSRAFFRWKHMRNPFGRSLMLLAEERGRIVGVRAFMRWRFMAGDETLTAVRAVDTATHPEFQGRGIFTRLTLAAVEELRADTDLIFNTPNEKSLPGYLKMGWQIVGQVPIRVRIRRPVRFARRVGSLGSEPGMVAVSPVGVAAADGLATVTDPSVLRSEPDARIHTDGDEAYFGWRYGEAPELGYRALVDDGAAVLFRVRPRGRLLEATAADVLAPAGDVAARARLLRRVGRAGRVDHVTCSFPLGSAGAAAARRAMFVRAPRGMTLTARPLRDDLPLDVTDLRNWAAVLGDLEVF